MAEKKKMSVAEILAAARSSDGGAKGAPPAKVKPAVQAADTSADDAAHVDASGAEQGGAAGAAATPKPKPAAKQATQPAGGARPSVSDILAMARANKGDGDAAAAKPVAAKPVAAKTAAAAKPATAKPATAKPAADKPEPAAPKPAAAKAKPAAPAATAAAQTGVKRDTASILAAARAGAKPGPMSKAEAPPAVTARLQQAARPKAAATEESAKAVSEKSPKDKVAAARATPVMPARPAKPAAKAGEEDRRGFLEIALGSFMALGFSALSVTGGLFTLGLARFMFPNVLAEPPSRFKVGFKEGFPTGKVETKFVPQYGVWVVNGDIQGQQQIYALKTICTHLGCTPNWLEAEQKFKCPCHGSGFYKDGVNFEGPAPRPLERYAIRIGDDGQLEIDKSRSFQEELGQWADPDSYVTA